MLRRVRVWRSGGVLRLPGVRRRAERLFGEEAVEAGDGLLLKRRHPAGAIEDESNFGEILIQGRGGLKYSEGRSAGHWVRMLMVQMYQEGWDIG